MCTDEVPPTIILRPVVVVDTTPGVRRDPAYAATVDDVLRWEAQVR